MKPKLFVLVGATGVGKTKLALSIAEHLHTPIINADSRQMFHDIPIGTAAPTKDQLKRVKHYFVGNLKLTDYYSAACFEKDVMNLLTNWFSKNSYALMSGGSMMYIDAVCNGIDDIPTVDNETRKLLKEKYEHDELQSPCSELKLLDPEYYQKVDLRNYRRVVHALEIIYMTGKPYSSFLTGKRKERPFDIVKIGLERTREELYCRINSRVEKMIASGLTEECRKVLKYRHTNALNTVGYKEIFSFLDGLWTLDFAKEKIKQHTRSFARKQMTWMRKDPDIRMFHPDNKNEIMNYIDSYLRN